MAFIIVVVFFRVKLSSYHSLVLRRSKLEGDQCTVIQ